MDILETIGAILRKSGILMVFHSRIGILEKLAIPFDICLYEVADYRGGNIVGRSHRPV